MKIAERRLPLEFTRRSRTGLGLGVLRLVAVPFGMVTQIAVSRAAGSVAMGEYAVMLSIVGVLAALMNAGVPTYAARELPRLDVERHQAEARKLLGVAAVVIVVLGAAWVPAGPAIARWVRIDSSYLVMFVIWCCAAAVAVLTLAGGFARGSGAFRLATVAESSWTSIIVGLVVAAAALAGRLHSARAVLGVRTIVVAAGAVWLVARWWRLSGRGAARARTVSGTPVDQPDVDDDPLAHGPPVASARGPLVTLSLVILAATVANWVQGQLPLWRLSSSGDSAARAEFVAVGRMTQLAALPGAVALMMSSPALARRGAGEAIDEARLRWRVTQSTGAVLAYGLLVVAGSSWLLEHVWDIGERDAVLVAAILIAGHVVHTATGPCGYALIMANRERYPLGAAIAGALVGLAVAQLASGSAGAVTAAVTVTAALVATNALNIVMCRRLLGLRTWMLLRPSR